MTSIPLRDRIDRFHAHQRAWSSLSWTAESLKLSVRSMGSDTVWTQHDLADNPLDHDILTVNQIGSALRGTRERHWSYTLPGIQVRHSTTDSKQDLLIVVRYPEALE